MKINHFKPLQIVYDTLDNPSFYWQLIAIIACAIISFIFYKISRYLIYLKKKDRSAEKSTISMIVVKYLPPLLWPIIAMLTLTIGLLIFNEFGVKTFLFLPLIKLIGLFLANRSVKTFFSNNYLASISADVLSAVILLNIFGILEPTIKYLDSLSLAVGTFKISAYTVVKALMTLLVVFWLSGLISKKTKYYIQNNDKIKPNTKGIISKVIDIMIYIALFIILLQVFGIDMTTFAVVGGAIAVGIGLGLQKIASNFIGGIILLFEKSVEIGDMVQIDDKIEGTITEFGSRYTLLETSDGKEVMVPNEDFIIKKVINLTYSNSRGRIEIEVGVSYDSDLEKAQEILINTAKEHPKCLLYPSPEVFVTKFGEYSINLVLYFWINNVIDGRSKPKSDVMVEILKNFKANNIEIPFPQRNVNLAPKELK